jgi:hypothetical protein
LLKNSKCSESLQIKRERRPRHCKPNTTHLGSNERQEREISRSVQNGKQAKKRVVDCTVRTIHTNDDMADGTDDVAGCTLTWQTVIGKLAYDMFCWQRMRRRHVAQSKAATCHLFVG